MPVRIPGKSPIRCPRCRASMGVWKSNCLRCNAAIPPPAAALPPPALPHRHHALWITLCVVGAIAAGGYASSRMPGTAITVQSHASPLLTALNRKPYQRTRQASARLAAQARPVTPDSGDATPPAGTTPVSR